MIQVSMLDHIGIPTTDLARARLFYHDLLGMEEVERPDPIAGAWFRAGIVVIQLLPQTQPAAPASGYFSLWVEDVAEAVKDIQAAGFKVQPINVKVPGLKRFLTHDPDGNQIEIRGSDGQSFRV